MTLSVRLTTSALSRRRCRPAIVENDDADWSFGHDRAWFIT